MGMLSSLRKRWRIGQDKTLDIQQKASHVGGVYSGITKALRLAVQSAAIALGAHLVLAQEIAGMLIAGSILLEERWHQLRWQWELGRASRRRASMSGSRTL